MPNWNKNGNTYLTDLARGIIPGARPFGGYGERTTTGAESNVLWPNGTYTLPPSAGVQMTIASTSANDDSAGTGARTIDVHYLDANLAEQMEIITMDGVSNVLTVATDIRFIQCMHLRTWGSGAVAAGTITAKNGGVTYAQISTGALRCSSSVRMVPAGYRLMVNAAFSGSLSGSAAAGTIVRLATPTFEGHDFTSSSVFMPLASAPFQDNSGGLRFDPPLPFTEGQSVGLTFVTDKAATITGSWFGWLEPA